jgi:hypothetical protein
MESIFSGEEEPPPSEVSAEKTGKIAFPLPTLFF